MLLVYALASIMLIIFAGWLARALKYIPSKISEYVATFLFKISFPAILFWGVTSEPIHHLDNYQQFFWYLVVIILTVYLLGLLINTIFIKNNWPEKAFFSLNATFMNAYIIAFPILYALIGRTAVVYASILVFADMIPLIITQCIIDCLKHDDTRVVKIIIKSLKGMLKNPIIVAFFIAILFQIFDIKVPKVINIPLAELAKTGPPMALFLIGLDLDFSVFRRKWQEIAWVSFLKLIIMPSCALLLITVAHPSHVVALGLLVCCSVATAKTTYVIAKQNNVYVEETSSIVVGTTILGLITIPIFLYLFHIYS